MLNVLLFDIFIKYIVPLLLLTNVIIYYVKHGITDILYTFSILSLVECIRILILLKVAPMTGAVAVVLRMYNYGL